MALIKFTNHVDVGGFELRNAKVEVVGSLPSVVSTDEGRVVYLTTTNRFYISTGSAWELKATDSDNLGGQAGSYYLSRSNHTGTQAASTISDFNTAVRTNRLDQMAVPTASVSLNSQKITGLLAGTGALDAVNKTQLDAVEAIANAAGGGVNLKNGVHALATTNITLSGTQTIDGVALVATNRVLVTAQTNPVTNGIYVVAAGAWSRSTDADDTGELPPGTLVRIDGGTENANSVWGLIGAEDTIIGTDAQDWQLVLEGSANAFTVAGAGLEVSAANTVAVNAGPGILADGSSTRIDPSVVVRGYHGGVPAGTGGTAITVTHALNSTNVTFTVKETSTGDVVTAGAKVSGVNTIELYFGADIDVGDYDITVAAIG